MNILPNRWEKRTDAGTLNVKERFQGINPHISLLNLNVKASHQPFIFSSCQEAGLW